MKQTLETTAQDVTRIGAIGDALAAGWAKIPVFYHYALQIQLPMTEAEFEAVFVKSMRLFLANAAQQECPGYITNTDFRQQIFAEPFLLMGVGVLAMGEGLSFAQPGEVRSAEIIQGIKDGSVSPRIFGCVPTGTPEDAGTRFPSKLWYGGPTWRLIEKFFQAKRFVMRAGRCEIINENLFELGMLYTPPVFKGASSSDIPTMSFVRETNDVMEAKNIPFGFLPVNTSLITAVIGSEPLQFNGGCAPNSGVTYGHPVVPHLANRIYCLQRPLLVTKDTRVDLEFQTVDNDCCLIPAARRAATLTCETPINGLPAFTSDGWPASSCTVPAGCLTLGIVLKGYTCTPAAVADYLANYMTCGYEKIYANSPYLANVAQKFGLQGVVKGALPAHKG